MKISSMLEIIRAYTRANKYAKYGGRACRELKRSERKSEINVSKKRKKMDVKKREREREGETCNERENMLISRPALYIWK